MAERLSASGYAALVKEAVKGTPLTPTTFVPYYKQAMMTNWNVIEDNPVYGNKFKSFQTLPGQRSHKGTLTVMAEANTAALWLDMLLTKSSTSGAGPYVHNFGLSGVTDPNSYTLDISDVSQVIRYFGVQANKLAPTWSGDEMQFQVSLSALGSFAGREIASVAAQVITLTTSYDPNPTTGLVVGDLVSGKSPDGTVRNLAAVVSSVTATTVTVTGTITGLAAGDLLVLRPVSAPSLNTVQPFIWPLTTFQFGVTATAAAAANQTRIESGVTVDIMHDFESDDGAGRSGGFDPAALVRTRGDYSFKIKEYFDAPDKLKDWLAINKKACVMTAVSPSNSAYKFAMTMNNLRIKTINIPTGSDEVIYQEEEFTTNYDQTDGQGMSFAVTNGIAVV